MKQYVYADNAATTKIDKDAYDAMIPYILEEEWEQAEKIACNLEGFVPSLFKKQEVFWDKKLLALKEIITAQRKVDGYDFCRNLVPLKRRASELAVFFCRGLMLSDIQYTSYD